MISCSLCEKKLRSPAFLTRHMVSHTKEKPHKCPVCSAAFGLDCNLKTHLKHVHDCMKDIKKRNFHCALCSYKFWSKTLLEKHIRKHSAEKPFSCHVSSCGFKTKHKNSLPNHILRAHSDKRRYKCPSEGCSYKAKCKGSLKSHLKIHSNEKPFACNVPGCNYICKKKQYLTDHSSRAHSDQKPFKCSACDFRAKIRSNLIQHEKTHVNVKRYECQAPKCGFASATKNSVHLYFDAKHRKKVISCTEPGCDYRCGSVSVLKVHLTKHKLPNRKCPGLLCSYRTVFKTNLFKHICRHHEDLQSTWMAEPQLLKIEESGAMETLNCGFPNCRFQNKFPHNYECHRRTHEEAKRKHVCSFCFSRFRHLCTLTDHLQRHVGENPLRCSHCEYSTASSSELRFHARNKHHVNVLLRHKENEVRECRTCEMNFWSYSEFVLHTMNHLQPIVVIERLKLQVL